MLLPLRITHTGATCLIFRMYNYYLGVSIHDGIHEDWQCFTLHDYLITLVTLNKITLYADISMETL